MSPSLPHQDDRAVIERVIRNGGLVRASNGRREFVGRPVAIRERAGGLWLDMRCARGFPERMVRLGGDEGEYGVEEVRLS